MAERPVSTTDAAIGRLLARGPLHTAAIAARLAIPARTARHRLRQLRQSGTVVTGTDGLHRLAVALPPGVAATGPGLAATGDDRAAPGTVPPDRTEIDGENEVRAELPGGWTMLAVFAVVGIGLAAAAIRRRPPDPRPSPMVDLGDFSRSWW